MNKEKNMGNIQCEIKQIENEIYWKSKKIDNLDAQIRRLENAYDSIQYLKGSVANNKNEAKQIVNHKYDWKGNRKNSFCNQGGNLIEEHEQYYKSLDEVADEIYRQKTNLINQKEESWGLIGWLRGRLRDLHTEINNTFN